MSVFFFAGDSITAAGRLWLPETNGLGDGYVAVLAARLKKYFPEAIFCNKGYDGFTVPALLRMLRRDKIPTDAVYITILAGINDVGIAMNTGVSLEKQDLAGNYQKLLSEISSRTRAQLLCCGPFVFPHPQEYAGWIPAVRRAEHIMARTAKENGAAFLPLHDKLNDAAKKAGYSSITTDGIHLTFDGHRLLASLLLPYYISGSSPEASCSPDSSGIS